MENFALISHARNAVPNITYYLFPQSERPGLSKGAYQVLGEWETAKEIIDLASMPSKEWLNDKVKNNQHSQALSFLAAVLTDKIEMNIPDLPLAEEMAIHRSKELHEILENAGPDGIPAYIQEKLFKEFRKS